MKAHPSLLKVETTEILGAAIRAKRKASGLTIAEAASLTGVGARFLSELERGKKTASLHLVLQVLERFGLELAVAPRGQIIYGQERKK